MGKVYQLMRGAPARDPNRVPNQITRASLIASYRGAVSRADTEDALVLNAASAAGALLARANGDVGAAFALLPPVRGAFWTRVAGYLEHVRNED